MKYNDDLEASFDSLTDLTVQQRSSIKHRIKFLLQEYRTRSCRYSALFYMTRLMITVGSLAVPALLSINMKPETEPFLYWLTWSISLAVTTSNGIVTLFKIDKRFFSLHATMERLRSEIWQYLELSGRYSGILGTSNHKPSHSNQYVYFCSQIERIRMKHIDDEYVKQANLDDTTAVRTMRPLLEDKRDVDVPTPADQITLIASPKDSLKENLGRSDRGDESPKNKETKVQQKENRKESDNESEAITLQMSE
jgi:hypothetical protein